MMRNFASLSIFVLALTTASCATGKPADEPQDLVAPNQRIETLRGYGWSIESPVDPSTAASLLPADAESATNDSQRWSDFLARLGPGDELRQVSNNAGRGYAIFRNDQLASLYLIVIY